MTTHDENHPANRLSRESSPYLLQHQYNPVDWYPWGEEAFSRARSENKPLLISIGYSACHWCHVMEHESFSNPEIAKLINDTVIPVKVDREERPDVDAIYMNACQAMSGHGGWPLNAFVTPDLKPFFVGTYFPPSDNYGRPGFASVLQKIREAWALDGKALVQQADNLHQQLEHFSSTTDSQNLAPDLLETVVRDSASMYDLRHGGFGSAPKFPPDTRLALLLAAYDRHKSQSALDMTIGTLTAMARGGIYDQIAGGFARYSVDAQWLIPHFEKMLYNQALLIPVYVDAWLLTGEPLFDRIARETADWVLRELTDEVGVFQCAYDADSEGEEGKFYVWTPEQIQAILSADDAKLFIEYYGITSRGNFEHGTSNPHVSVAPEEFARRHGIAPDEWLQRLDTMRATVRQAREKRVWPGLDDKCLAGWNGLMITALCRLAQATGAQSYADAAARSAAALLKSQWNGQTLNRVWKDGRSSVRGTLEDYAFFADALIDLYQTNFDTHWLQSAKAIAERMVELFADATDGGFFYTDGTDTSLISRTRDTHDGALPASASIATKVLLRLSHIYRDEKLAAQATSALTADGRRANQHPMAFASLILANLYAEPTLPEIVITANSVTEAQPLLSAIRSQYMPAAVIAVKIPGTDDLPILTDRPAAETPQAYVCRNFTCQAPVTDPENLVRNLTQ